MPSPSTRRSHRPARRHAPRAAGFALACLLGAVGLWPSAARPVRASGPVVGAPLAGDMTAWSAGRLRALSQRGGRLGAVAMDPIRPVAWVGVGPRVVALSVPGQGARVLGRSPALPGLVTALAAGEGFVLAMVEAAPAPATAWLVDGRDPAWPRDARPVEGTAPVRHVAASGARGLVATADALLLLDPTDVDAPATAGRLTLGTAARSLGGVRRVALDDQLAIVAGERQLAVVDFSTPAAPRIASTIEEPGIEELALDEGVLALLDGSRLARLYDLRDPEQPQSRSEVAPGTVGWTAALALHGNELYTLDRGPSLLLRRSAIAPGATATARKSSRHLATTSSSTLSTDAAIGLAVGEGGAALLGGLPELLMLTPEQLRLSEGALDDPWRPIPSGARGLHLDRGRLLLSTGFGDAWQLDAAGSRPAAPPLGWRVPSAQADEELSIRDGMLFDGHWWLAARYAVHVVDASDRRAPEPRAYLPLRGVHAFGRVGEYLVAHDSTKAALAFYAPGPEGWRAPVGQLPVPPMIVSDYWTEDATLWVAGRVPSSASGLLLAVDAGDPRQPQLLSSLALRSELLAVAKLGDHVAVLAGTAAVPGTLDELAVIDARDPRATRLLGSVEVGHPHVTRFVRGVAIPLHRGDLTIDGEHVLVAHPERGLVWFDLSIPDFPTEVDALAIPGGATTIASDGPRHWIGTLHGGLVLVAPSESDGAVHRRLWLPYALGAP